MQHPRPRARKEKKEQQTTPYRAHTEIRCPLQLGRELLTSSRSLLSLFLPSLYLSCFLLSCLSLFCSFLYFFFFILSFLCRLTLMASMVLPLTCCCWPRASS